MVGEENGVSPEAINHEEAWKKSSSKNIEHLVLCWGRIWSEQVRQGDHQHKHAKEAQRREPCGFRCHVGRA